jgi:hypothetical protein
MGHRACLRNVAVVVSVHCQCVLMCGQILEHRNRMSTIDNTDVCLPGVLLFVVRQLGELGSHSRRFPLWACSSYSTCERTATLGMHIVSVRSFL